MTITTQTFMQTNQLLYKLFTHCTSYEQQIYKLDD